MDILFERSRKEKDMVYVAAEQAGTAFFAGLRVGKRELLHAASVLCAAAMLHGAAKRQKRVARAQKAALRRIRGIGKEK